MPHRTVADIAEQIHVDPVDEIVEIALQNDTKVFCRQPLLNESQGHVLEMMPYPRSVVTFSDLEAHLSQIINSLLQTETRACSLGARREYPYA